MSGSVDLVGQIEDVKTDVVGNISEIDLLFRVQTKFYNMLNFLSGNTRNSSHDFVDFMVNIAEVTTDTGVPHDSSDIFHSIGTVIRRNRTGFSDWVNVSEVSNWRIGYAMHRAHVFVDFFVPKV